MTQSGHPAFLRIDKKSGILLATAKCRSNNESYKFFFISTDIRFVFERTMKMIKYHFTEATPLIEFVKKNEQRVVGKTLVSLCVPFWLEKGRYSMSDEPIILEMADYCIVVSYFLTSDLIIEIGTKEELQSNDNLNSVLRIKDDTEDYYQEEFELGENKEDIEGHKITEIRIERFSSEFEYNLAGDTRPEGGDYFSTIRIYLDSGKTLCICGEPAESDGWIDIWCEY